MKRGFIAVAGLFSLSLAMASCGGETVDGAALAKEVCDCYTNANGMDASDPTRADEQAKCSELQKTNWDKVSGNSEQESAFNDAFPCGM